MEYNIEEFTARLKELFLSSSLFPYLSQDYINKYGWAQSPQSKHSKRNPLHLKDAVRECFNETTYKEQDSITFDMGSPTLEKNYPYYHILEDAPVIRKKGKGTDKTKGSQRLITNVAERDYNKVSWNGKTFTKEYSRNVRGSRNRKEKVSHWTTNENGERVFTNIESNSYHNAHYKYIENILDSILPIIASEFGLKYSKGGKIDTGLAEEYFMQEDSLAENMLEILGSFAE